MTRWMAMVVWGAALAAGADLSYQPGSKLNLIFASWVRCEVKVVTRAVEWVTVAAAKAQPSCPAGSEAATLGVLTGSVVGGIAIGASGHKWTLYLNTSTLEEVQ